jgi:hypothetical protein
MALTLNRSNISKRHLTIASSYAWYKGIKKDTIDSTNKETKLVNSKMNNLSKKY